MLRSLLVAHIGKRSKRTLFDGLAFSLGFGLLGFLQVGLRTQGCWCTAPAASAMSESTQSFSQGVLEGPCSVLT